MRSTPSSRMMRAIGFDVGKHTAFGCIRSDGSAIIYDKSGGISGSVDECVSFAIEKIPNDHDVVGVEIVEGGASFEFKKAVRVGAFQPALAKKAMAKTQNLVQASAVANQIVGFCLGKLVCYPFSAMRWRKALVGKATPKDAEIERVLRLQISGLPGPRKTTTHERDALMVALMALRHHQWISCVKRAGSSAD